MRLPMMSALDGLLSHFRRMDRGLPANPGESIARVTAVDRDQYLIRNAESEVPAKLTGRAVYASESPADLPCVGDWVRVKYHDSGAHASILDVLPRQSFLRRKRPATMSSSR